MAKTYNKRFYVLLTVALAVMYYSNYRLSHATLNTNDKKKNPNVLFIMVDDLRTQLGFLQSDPQSAKPNLLTPNLNKLASESLVLMRAYVQYTLCNPSRSSILTSRRPDTTKVYGNFDNWREKGGNFTTIPQYFKERGYETVAVGKIFHGDRDKLSWSLPYLRHKNHEKRLVNISEGAVWLPVPQDFTEKYPLPDNLTVIKAREALEAFASSNLEDSKPFFLAVGFMKPHLSLICPEKFFDEYPLESADDDFLADDAWKNPRVRQGCNLKNVQEAEEGTMRLPTNELIQHRRAYFACVSYVDSLVGELLKALEDLQLDDSTIVSFIADHGYHLGENDLWGKYTVLERATHVPMMLKIPGRTDHGVSSKSIVEAVDLMPTLAEAAGLEVPPPCPKQSSDIPSCTQGISILPLVDDHSKQLKGAAFSQVQAMNYKCYTMRSPDFRYTEWFKTDNDGHDLTTDPEGFWTELYDHEVDKDEMYNVTAEEKYQDIKYGLRQQLHEFVKSQHGT